MSPTISETLQQKINVTFLDSASYRKTTAPLREVTHLSPSNSRGLNAGQGSTNLHRILRADHETGKKQTPNPQQHRRVSDLHPASGRGRHRGARGG